MTTKIGFCRYCNNQRMVEVPDDATGQKRRGKRSIRKRRALPI